MNKLLLITSLTLLCITIPSLAEGAGSSFFLSPGSGTFFVGSTFDVSVFVNTEGNSINAVQADLKFPANLLQVASPTTGSSFIQVWAEQPFYSNREGIISFKGGVPFPGIKTSAGLVSTITFRVKASGQAVISFLDSSRVLLADGKGTNVLKSTGVSEYSLIIAPPEGPKVFSPTHPSLSTWYKNNNPSFYWEREGGVTGFSYVLDKDPQGVPDNVSEGEENSITLNDVSDGIWYFHIRAKKGNIWGGVTHYPVQIDNTPPKDFTIDIEKIAKIAESRFFAYFSTDDLPSGVDYYEVSTVNMSDSQALISPFFVESPSPYKIPFETSGKYVILVRGYDRAGNFVESKSTLNIISSNFSYTEKGVRLRNLYLPWWLIYSLIIVLFCLFSFKIYPRLFKKKDLGKRLKQEVAEAEREIEDVKNMEEKIRQMRALEEEARRESDRLAEKLKEKDKT